MGTDFVQVTIVRIFRIPVSFIFLHLLTITIALVKIDKLNVSNYLRNATLEEKCSIEFKNNSMNGSYFTIFNTLLG